MKKKSERFSVKKLTPTHRRHQAHNRFDGLLYPNDKFKSHVKNNSSEKYTDNSHYNHNNYKFKIYKPSSSDKARTKTEVDEQITMKAPYQKYLTLKKKDAEEKNKSKVEEKQKKKQKSFLGTHYHIDNKHKFNRLMLNT